MTARSFAADLHTLAARSSARLRREHMVEELEQDDVRQELLLDLLGRLGSYNAQRGPWRPFVLMCFEHRFSRMVRAKRHQQRGRHPAALDAPAPDQPEIALIETLAAADGYGAWIGQQVDEVEHLDMRFDLARAMATLPRNAITLCASLLAGGSGSKFPKLPRATHHRRLRELRYQLLAAGIGPRGANRLGREY